MTAEEKLVSAIKRLKKPGDSRTISLHPVERPKNIHQLAYKFAREAGIEVGVRLLPGAVYLYRKPELAEAAQ